MADCTWTPAQAATQAIDKPPVTAEAPPATPVDMQLSEGAKVDALLCLLLLAARAPSLRLFDRLWPHFVELTDVKHHSAEVRSAYLLAGGGDPVRAH